MNALPQLLAFERWRIAAVKELPEADYVAIFSRLSENIPAGCGAEVGSWSYDDWVIFWMSPHEDSP